MDLDHVVVGFDRGLHALDMVATICSPLTSRKGHGVLGLTLKLVARSTVTPCEREIEMPL